MCVVDNGIKIWVNKYVRGWLLGARKELILKDFTITISDPVTIEHKILNYDSGCSIGWCGDLGMHCGEVAGGGWAQGVGEAGCRRRECATRD